MVNTRKTLGALTLTGAMVIGGMATATPASARDGMYYPPCNSMGCPQPVWTGGGQGGKFGENVSNGYRAANKWCSDNSLACAVGTGLVFLLISPFTAPARG